MDRTELNFDEIKLKTQAVLMQLLEIARLRPGRIIVVGCSTSEIQGKHIGSASAIEIAEAVIDGVLPGIKDRQFFLAAQCCEHLNRALVVESDCAEANRIDVVSVVPQLKAGGAFATEVYRRSKEPVVIERIEASAGIDIGDTFIGMHIKPVVVPVRPDIKKIGAANVTMARSRPKLIGGERSMYKKYI